VTLAKTQTIKKTDRLTLQKCDHLNILWLKGTPIERARMHGELMGHEFTCANLDLFIQYSLRGLKKNTLKFKLIDLAIQNLVRFAARGAPQSYLDETRAMSEAMKIQPLELRRAILLPDIAAFSWALLSQQGKNLSLQGCTSAVYTNEGGEYLQGRNLDFPGSPVYDDHPLLVVHLPEDGSSELKHVSIGTHGLQFSGISGFNEAGITFAVHQNYTRLLSIKGTPMPFVGELVLRSARSLNEAVEIIRKNRPGPMWSFVVGDLKTQNTLTVEVSNTHISIRKKEGHLFAQTNHLMNSDFRKDLSLMEAGTFTNSPFRFQKALDEMKTWSSSSSQKMAELLAWQHDQKDFSPISDVMKPLTIQSIIYEKTLGESEPNFYVTIDHAPAAAGRWAQFKMNSFFQQIGFNEITIRDFTKTSATVRAQQIKWTEVYNAEIMRLYPKAIEKMGPLVNSPDSYMALAAFQLKTKDVTNALVSVQKGLEQAKPTAQKIIIQGLKWLEIACLIQMEKMDLVLTKAQSLSNENILDPGMAEQLKKVLRKEKPSKASLEPSFDFFGGYIQGMPFRLPPYS
jgi:hypothetical protein